MTIGKILAILAGIGCMGYVVFQALSVPRLEYLTGGLVLGIIPLWLLPIVGLILIVYGWIYL